MTRPLSPPRRTQEERRAETRARLLEATIRCVLEEGYQATTVRRVAEVAGVSQGAQTHHYPRRVDLVGAAVEWLAERRLRELRQTAAGLPQEPRARLGALLDLIWADFSSSTFAVFVKLWIAAADDSDLYARLVPVERRFATAVAELASRLSGDLQVSDAGARLDLVLAAQRGLALTQCFEPHRRRRRDSWPAMRRQLLDLLEQPSASEARRER